MPKTDVFTFDWYLKLSKYNTLRYEDLNRANWQNNSIGTFIRNDRFCCNEKPKNVNIIIRKVYEIAL